MNEHMQQLLDEACEQDEETAQFSLWSDAAIASFPLKPYEELQSFKIDRFDYPYGDGFDIRLSTPTPTVAETDLLARYAWRGAGGSGDPDHGLYCAAIASVELTRALIASVLWIGARLKVYQHHTPDAAARFIEGVAAVDWHNTQAVVAANFQPMASIGAHESSADTLYNWCMTINRPVVARSMLGSRFQKTEIPDPSPGEIMSGAALLALDCALAAKTVPQMTGLVSLAANAMWQAGFQSGWEGRGEMLRDDAKSAGSKGGELRHKASRALKDWALAEAAHLRGADIDIARTLARRIPREHRDASADPERLIYQALRDARKGTPQGG